MIINSNLYYYSCYNSRLLYGNCIASATTVLIFLQYIPSNINYKIFIAVFKEGRYSHQNTLRLLGVSLLFEVNMFP